MLDRGLEFEFHQDNCLLKEKQEEKQKLHTLKREREREIKGGALTNSIRPCNRSSNVPFNWNILKVNNATP